MRDPDGLELPGGEARPLEQRPGLERESLGEDAARERFTQVADYYDARREALVIDAERGTHLADAIEPALRRRYDRLFRTLLFALFPYPKRLRLLAFLQFFYEQSGFSLTDKDPDYPALLAETEDAGPDTVDSLPADVIAALTLDADWLRNKFPDTSTFLDVTA